MKKRINKLTLVSFQLFLIVVLFLYNLPIARAQIATGLVAAYGFEEGSGTALLDQSGNSNHGTLMNGPVWTAAGRYGKALQFDGVNDLVSIPDSNSLDLTTNMTLEAWVYPTSTLSGWDTIIMKEYTTGLLYALYANGDGNLPQAYITSSGVEHGFGGGSTLPLNTWTHLAATYDGNVIRLFVNGNQVNTLTYAGTIQTSNRGLGIGGNLIWTDEGFPGLIDEVRIYNRTLTSSEIVSDMQTPVTSGVSTVSPSPTRTSTSTAQVPSSTATFTRTPTPLIPPSSTPTSTRTPTRTPTLPASPSSTPQPTLVPSQTPTSAPIPTSALGVYAYPLKPSLNGRYYVDQNNVPFFINGDTPWSLIGQVSNEDAEFYLQDAASKGINSIIVTLTESHYADNAPANYYGVQPFTTPNLFTTPNEAYFAHADWVINKAAQYGLQVIIAPNYLGCCTDGWWDELMNNNSVSDAAWYGTYIGNRYKNFPNIMYVWGDDTNPCGVNSTVTSCTQRDKIRAMAQAVFVADPIHLQTYHASPEYSALDIFDPSVDPWLTTNITYTYQPVQIKSLQDYNRNPVMPFFLFESHYERDWANKLPIDIRTEAYVAILSGAAGHQYGNNPIWHMNGIPGDNTNTWKQHLNDEGRSDLPHIRALFESRAWYTLVPDQNHTAVTAGFGSATGSDYVGTARTSDGSTVIAYLPSQVQVTVNMTKISGTNVKAWWFDPRSGTAQLIGTFPATGNQNFTPPTNADWVLVLDNASLNLPAPGTGTFSLPTSTPSSTPTVTAISSPTLTPSVTASVTASSTSANTLTPSSTPTVTPSFTATMTPLPTSTATASATASFTPTSTNTPLPTFSTGFLSPSANAAVTASAGDNNGYQTSPANAYANDGVFAVDTNSGNGTSTSCTSTTKDRHNFYNYNFNITPSAVQGIEIRLDARVDATSGAPKICVQLSWDGGITWATAKNTPSLTTTEATYVLGSPSDTWGRTWASSNFSNTNFRVRVIDVSSSTSRDFSLDYVAVNVTYTP